MTLNYTICYEIYQPNLLLVVTGATTIDVFGLISEKKPVFLNRCILSYTAHRLSEFNLIYTVNIST